MTSKKLKILGPYTPEHEGPYVWVEHTPTVCTVHAVVRDLAFITADGRSFPFLTARSNIRNAEEVPEAREFWINEYRCGDGSISASRPRETECEAARECQELPNWDWVRTIHVREVLPGEGE
ncbi:hypothetical protein [Acetobacter oryzifermentans]|uniref:Phage protein n=1 Tax=Acetobacter oryzifermentans TaxID=1633874 RepID=A0ABN4NME9_9PROT|nr:hypothetical protein [Acetobacter oryzifermentans]ANA12893.1 hypothetical protein WG31_01720 [Acetobacter oryzifermentans]